MDDIKNLKLMCRKAALLARFKAHKMSLDSKANAQLVTYLKAQKDNLIISAYMPIRTEISPLMAMDAMVRRGRIVCVPVVIADESPLEFHRWTPECEMIQGAFGAMIPKNAEVLIPDLVITPLAAFDMNGYRLGYGGGYYDRSFAEIKKTKNVQAIGFAYSAQEVMLVPRENTDYQLNSIITEQGILSF